MKIACCRFSLRFCSNIFHTVCCKSTDTLTEHFNAKRCYVLITAENPKVTSLCCKATVHISPGCNEHAALILFKLSNDVKFVGWGGDFCAPCFCTFPWVQVPYREAGFGRYSAVQCMG